MNKQEFKSAYNKITLSEEFKAGAKAKLAEQFAAAAQQDDVSEERASASISFTKKEKSRSPWKAIVGTASAAAVVGLGIWGGSALLNRDDHPLDGQDTVEAVQTSEVTESMEVVQSAEAPETVEAVEVTLAKHSVALPTYRSENWIDTVHGNLEDMEPFQLNISLPDGWAIEVDTSDEGDYSPVNITENGEIIGSVDYNAYDRYSEEEAEEYGIPQFGDPNYHQYVFSPLMLGSRVNWGSEYTPVKEVGWFCSATCQVMVNESEAGYNDNIVNYPGILAYNDQLGVSVNIMFNRQLDEVLHRDIADHIGIAESKVALGKRLAQLYVKNSDGFGDSVRLDVQSVDFEIGQCVFFNTHHNNGTDTVDLYIIEDGRIAYGERLTSADGIDGVDVAQGKTAFKLNIRQTFDERYEYDEIVYVRENGELVKNYFRYSCYYLTNRNEFDGIRWYDRSQDDWIDISHSEYVEKLDAIDSSLYGYGGYEFDCREIIDTTGNSSDIIARIAPIVVKVLDGTYVRPEEAPEPTPPHLWLNHDGSSNVADGSEKPFYMGSYNWGGSSQEFRIEDNIGKLEAFGTYPSTYFRRGAIIAPEDDGVIKSVCLNTDDDNGVPLEFTQKGVVTLPNEYNAGITYYVIVTVEYPDGECDYIFPIYFPESVNPPELTFAAGGQVHSLRLGSAYWHGNLSGNPVSDEAAYREWRDGSISSVTGCTDVRIHLPDDVRMIEALYIAEDSSQKQLEISGSDVVLPKGESGLVRLGMEFPDGSVSYWFGFDNYQLVALPEKLTASCGGAEFMLSSGSGWKWNYDMGYCSFPQDCTSISVALPEGARLIEAFSENSEGYRQEIPFTDDGTIWLPYYLRFAIYLTVEDISSGEQVEYGFMYESNNAPVITAEAGGESVTLFCESWSYWDTMWGYEKDSSQAAAMLGGEIPRISDSVGSVKISLPQHNDAKLISVTAYDRSGNVLEAPFTADGTITLPETGCAVIRVKLCCFEGSAYYWLGFGNPQPVNLPAELTAASGSEEFVMSFGTQVSSYITLPEYSFRINIPAGKALTHVYEGEYENALIMEEDGTIHLPFFRNCTVSAVVEDMASGERAVYSFGADCRRAPELTVRSGGESITPMCVFWRYYDDNHGTEIDYITAFSQMGGEVQCFAIPAETVTLLRPAYYCPQISSITAYGRDGREYSVKIDGGQLTLPDVDYAVIRLELNSYSGTGAVYWFGFDFTADAAQ